MRSRHPWGRKLGSVVVVVLVLTILDVEEAWSSHDPSAPAAKHALFVSAVRQDTPVGQSTQAAVRDVLDRAFGADADLYSEFLDTYRFPLETNLERHHARLRTTYSGVPLRLVIATSPQALAVVMRGRQDVFRNVPIAYFSVAPVERPLASAGLGAAVDFTSTLDMALQLQPDVRRVVVIGGAGEPDRWLVRIARAQFEKYGRNLAFEYLEGQSLAAMENAVRRPGPRSIVYFIMVTKDGDGRNWIPADLVQRLGALSAVPIYGWHENNLGYGIVGGRLYSSEEAARRTAEIGVRILQGRPPEAIPFERVDVQRFQADVRQLRRWRLEADRLPEGTAVEFREPLLSKRAVVLAIVSIVALLGVAAILYVVTERRRRRGAEARARQYLSAMADLDRRASAGQLVASVTHELYQPLGAILVNTEAAERMLSSGNADPAELRALLNDIRRDDERADGIIRRLRSVLQRHELAERVECIEELVQGAVALAVPRCRERGVEIEIVRECCDARVRGDRIHLQQALLNLILNAVDAMHEAPPQRRQVTVRTQCTRSQVEICIEDRGTGLPPGDEQRVFEAFYSTKTEGLGMGLFIVRSIVEAHRGRVVASNRDGGGAAFCCLLPAAGVEATPVAAG